MIDKFTPTRPGLRKLVAGEEKGMKLLDFVEYDHKGEEIPMPLLYKLAPKKADGYLGSKEESPIQMTINGTVKISIKDVHVTKYYSDSA